MKPTPPVPPPAPPVGPPLLRLARPGKIFAIPAIIPAVKPKPPVVIQKDCPPTVPCRILLNEARREIDRLRRGLATPPIPFTPPAERHERHEPPDAPKPQPPRRLYAVDPIGVVSLDRNRRALPPTEPGVKVVTRPHVTNVGSAIDVVV